MLGGLRRWAHGGLALRTRRAHERSVLEEMAREKRKAVAARRSSTSLASIRDGLSPSDRSLLGALQRSTTGLVLGCKARSLVQGNLVQHYAPGSMAAAYAPFASAVAVWTDADFYGGELAHLTEVRTAAPQPVLCADLVVDPYQVYEARRYGADGMMLHVALLPQQELEACIRAAASLRMDCALVVHDRQELDRALTTTAPIIVVDNRDLRTLEIDRNTCARLASAVPEDRVLLCQAGIRNHRDILAMRDLVDGFVVATSLMRARDAGQAVRSLAFGRVCIDDLRRPADARAARMAGATHGSVTVGDDTDLDRLARIVAGSSLRVVADLRAPTPSLLEAVTQALRPAAVRLPPNTRPDRVRELATACPEACELWGSYHPSELEQPRTASELGVDRVELDLRPKRREPIAPGIARLHPRRSRVVLRGVLPEQAAIADEVAPWATRYRLVDERRDRLPGRALEALFETLRGLGR